MLDISQANSQVINHEAIPVDHSQVDQPLRAISHQWLLANHEIHKWEANVNFGSRFGSLYSNR